MLLIILAAFLVALLLIAASVFVGRVSRIDDKRIQDLEYNRANLDTLTEIRRLQSRGW